MPEPENYNPDYRKLYPQLHEGSPVLDVLKRGDRKMKYMEVNLKQERFVYDGEHNIALFLPSREDSYERLTEEEHQQFAQEGMSTEEKAIREEEYERLHNAMFLLTDEERSLIGLRYWHEMSQVETAHKLGLSQQVVSYREKKILCKLKKYLENSKFLL